MTNPWSALDAATQQKKLYLDPKINNEVARHASDYESKLTQLITDRLDDNSGYFGTDSNPLAKLLETAFNARGISLTNYLNAQRSQVQAFVKTAYDAATATANNG
jgi:lipopolysaccharide export system protein LptC